MRIETSSSPRGDRRPEMSVEESLRRHAEVLAEFDEAVGWNNSHVWGELTVSEKALCMNYKRQLYADIKISPDLIRAVNDIHERYPLFDMRGVP